MSRHKLPAAQEAEFLRDTENAVDIDVVITGDYPGDGKPKPVSFPDPSQEAQRGEQIRRTMVRSHVDELMSMILML